jgi:phosphatidate cytidylyltransferase
VDDRPTHPDGGDETESFRLLDSPDPWDPEPGDEPEEERRPIRARDLLDEPEDPAQFGAVPIVGADSEPPDDESSGDEPPDVSGLPHWTEPPTGEVPRILGGDDVDDSSWASLSSSQPRWRDQSSGWDDTDLSDLGDDLPPIGARDDSAAADDFFTFDDTSEPQPETFSVPRDPSEPYGGRGADPYAEGRAAGGVGGRNIGVAAVVGVGLAALGLVLINVGPAATMVLVVVVLVLASAEMLSTLRRVGYSPPALVGLAAAAALPLAAYWRGEAGIVLGVALTVVVCLLWYLLGVGSEHAVPNIGVTLLTVVYVGVLGSFAALLLRAPDGTGLLLAALLAPIAYDIAGLFIGRSMGRSPLSSASPNKTVEGTVGGMVAAFLVTWVVVGGVVGSGIAPFDSGGEALMLGLVLAGFAPVADLCESMLKRDLGVKDMGTILPGHGGVLDRFDSVLVSLPITYYLALVLL